MSSLNPLWRAIRAFRDEWLAAQMEARIAKAMKRAKLKPRIPQTPFPPPTTTERTKTEHRRIDITREDE